jgi:hypothetical protein
MSLVAKREKHETWRQAVERIAKPYGLERDCLEVFDQERASGVPEGKAAWNALYEWDCLDFVDDDAKAAPTIAWYKEDVSVEEMLEHLAGEKRRK